MDQLFLKEQGYGTGNPAVVYQDNLSAILLEKNRKRSSSKRTKNISTRFFPFVYIVRLNQISRSRRVITSYYEDKLTSM